MAEEQIIRDASGILVHLVDGKITKIEGDPGSANKGVLSTRELASLEILYHPDRLQHPLKRGGGRGEGKWQQISWDEALDTVADELTSAREKYGPESVAMINGRWQQYQDALFRRLSNVFGTPNVATSDYVCHFPTRFGSEITCGFSPQPDYAYPPACIIVWGTNLSATHLPIYRQIINALNKGTRLMVIDPLEIDLAVKADLWLRIRPGSDLALALGMINVIVNEGLYDRDFVDNWTVGFNELKAHVQDYPPEKVAEITWIGTEAIKEAARFYATHKPACIKEGNALHHNVNSFQSSRAISILRAITGNLGVPGGEILMSEIPAIGAFSPELQLRDKMPLDKWQNRLGGDLGLIPIFPDSIPPVIVKAILEGEPYRIHAAYIKSCNPLLSWSNAQRVYKALHKLDFLVVADMFMTPTAALADIVLPAAGYFEHDSIATTPFNTMAQPQQKLVQIGERWSDFKIINELAKRLGLGEYFWDSEEQYLDAILKPAGLNFEELKKAGLMIGAKQYRRYAVDGFKTPSGKVELYSAQLKEWGHAPLPAYYEPPETPYSNSELAREYPIIVTMGKEAAFIHSDGKQITSLRHSYPDPIIRIHAKTASKLGIKEGDWVYIETKRGRIKQKAVIIESIDPRVVFVDYGWWFPEKGIAELFGWADSNFNILTDDKPPYSHAMGSTPLRYFLCKVYKVP
jgi:anaerobic selenocysteine-containing dehydrogenase